MRPRRFAWSGEAQVVADEIRLWASELSDPVDVAPIGAAVLERGDAAVVELTNRFDATEAPLEGTAVDLDLAAAALAGLEPQMREALDVAAANVRAVARAQLAPPTPVELPQGQTVTLREVPVGAAGVYAPGGRAAYPSSVLMCAIPARAAGVGRVALASPPGPDGRLHPLVLAAAALCEVDEIHAMGGAQAIFALAYGTETIAAVDVIAGPGNAWVREAKRAVYGSVGIDSLAGPSELMLIAGHDADPEWAALDLCAQAEHGAESPLVVVAVEEQVLEAIAAAAERAAAERPSVADAPLALVQVPEIEAAIALANAYAPEHLELDEDDAELMAERVITAGCVFVGRFGATAFGDYVAGSNHVLPTGGGARWASGLRTSHFQRTSAVIRHTKESLAAAADHIQAMAEAEGLVNHNRAVRARFAEEPPT